MNETPAGREAVLTAAEKHGVCTRPVVRRLIDLDSGETRYVAIPCGARRERVCPACADRFRRLRMQQCREGWHLDAEPPEPPGVEVPDLTGLDLSDAQATAAEVVTFTEPYAGPLPHPIQVAVIEERSDSKASAGTVLDQQPGPGHIMKPDAKVKVIVSTGTAGDTPETKEDGAEVGRSRRVRSTRRLEGIPPLPKQPMSARTIGRQMTSPSGNSYRPSTFLTLTLPSYGPVHPDGTPRDHETYDYARAARDAMHFPALVDRFWQNLRRCAGWRVQYFACVEPQKRLALHLHAAVRGAITDPLLQAVAAATYHAVWWPPHDHPVYTDRLPIWDEDAGGYVDPASGAALPTWDDALDQLDTEDAGPPHVVRFGTQLDRQWFLPGTPRSDRRIGYLTKYLTKSVAEAYDDQAATRRERAHRDRLARETRWLPCGPECPNWLRFGVQPKDGEAGMRPGDCDRAAHDPDNLGHGGRRVLVSRQWSGKTLDEHRADRGAVVHAALAEAGIEAPETDRYAAKRADPDGTARFVWEPLDPTDPEDVRGYAHALRQSVVERIRWRNQYDKAKHIAARAGPNDEHSAIRQSHQAVA